MTRASLALGFAAALGGCGVQDRRFWSDQTYPGNYSSDPGHAEGPLQEPFALYSSLSTYFPAASLLEAARDEPLPPPPRCPRGIQHPKRRRKSDDARSTASARTRLLAVSPPAVTVRFEERVRTLKSLKFDILFHCRRKSNIGLIMLCIFNYKNKQRK